MLARRLRASAFRRGVLGDSSTWLAVWAVLASARIVRRLVRPKPRIMFSEKLAPGEVVVIRHGEELVVASRTVGFAGADLANLVNEAAVLAARRNKSMVDMQDFEDAKDKVMLGMERRSLVMTDEERKSTAFHEAGHALVAWLLPGSEPVDKVTIIPRGRALGLTQQLPLDDSPARIRPSKRYRLQHPRSARPSEMLRERQTLP